MVEVQDIIPINFEEDVIDRLKIKLVNRDNYKDTLDKIPHKFLADDLILTYWINLSNKPDEYNMLLITNNLLAIWGIDDFTLKDTALGKAEKEEPYSLQKLDIFSEKTDKDFMAYVLTNNSRLYGASVIAYPLMLPYICTRYFNSDEFYLIPSTIHEFILLPKEMVKKNIFWINYIIKEINRNIVDSKDVLSDHLYKYSFNDDMLKSLF